LKNTKLEVEDLKKIFDIKTRAIIYELLCIYQNKINQDSLVDQIYEIILGIHEKQEKGYLVEKKMLLKIKEAQKNLSIKLNLEVSNNLNYAVYKMAFIIARRLLFIQPSTMEFDSCEEVELSLLLSQITTDLLSYINTCVIFLKKKIDINEDHLKGCLLRTLKKYSNQENAKIKFELKKLGIKTIYFIKSNLNSKLFSHFYARVLL
jgi:hypothetical protein